jgi:RHS repeat-associated protein
MIVMDQNKSYSHLNNPSSNNKEAEQKNTGGYTAVTIPPVSLPKSGGAIKSIDDKFSVNAANGTSGMSIPFPFSSSRNDFMPAAALTYNSGSGNGIFGLGWSAEPAAITRRTDKQLPLYQDATDSDTFIFSGAEDLVPVYNTDGSGNYVKDSRTVNGNIITRYRPRIEGAFARIEKITEANGNVYWKVTTGTNVVSVFGKSRTAQLADPADPAKIYKWLFEFSYDDKGNCYQYEYKKEDKVNVPEQLHEKNRLNDFSGCTNVYLKRIKYGNTIHFHSNRINWNNWDNFLTTLNYLLELVLDYGEHDNNNPQPGDDHGWPCRTDAFSDYRSRFEVRTWRLCQRILMFHRFAELGTMPCLVRSLNLQYNTGTAFTFLTSVTQKGYIRKTDGTYSQKSLPPLAFGYEPLGWNTDVKTLPQQSLENVPVGLDDRSYQWTDLYREGIAGILTEQAGGWYYKSNAGDGNFEGLQPVASKPSLNGLATGDLHLQDIEAKGQQFLVSDNLQGYFELDDNNQWQSFKNFTRVAKVNLQDPNMKMLDLNGDGMADILISEESVFTWYASKGKEGYEPNHSTHKPPDEEKGAAIVFADSTESIVLADMSGDGLMDIVRIRYSEVCYWPNLGYGQFGAKVNMTNSPVFDNAENFNPQYIKLADLDGSGTTDIIYLGQHVFKIYLNQSGNSWSHVNLVTGVNPLPFPAVNMLTQVSVVDLLGNGTGCIVWSSPLPQHTGHQLQYIDLMGGRKPHVMISCKNNMGRETYVEYKPSTWFYLQDKKAGTPWITRLPFPVQCVSKVVTIDQIAKARFTSQYSYHHGYYDQAEREFRGFGRVEQTDTEDFEQYKKSADPDGHMQLVDERFYQPPVLTKTWYHTGAFIDREKIFTQFTHEYYQNNHLPEKTLTNPSLPADITIEEWREALRACKGTVLRIEVYAPDGSEQASHPYTTAHHSCLIKRLQPRLQNHYAVFHVQQSESLTWSYERNPADPRIAHSMTIATDEFGNVLQAATINYGRRTIDTGLLPAEQAEQGKTRMVYTQNHTTNAIVTETDYRTPFVYETLTFELTGVSPQSGDYFSINEIQNAIGQAATIPYEILPATGSLEKRLIEQERSLFRKNDQSGPLPLGIIESLALPWQSYKLSLTPGLRNHIFGNKITGDLLTGEGKYVHFNDDNYWTPSGLQTLDANNFYQVTQITDPFGYTSRITYDNTYRLFVQKTTDAANNELTVTGFNFRTLSPCVTKDINDNREAVRTDELGMVTSHFVMGKETENKGDLFDTASIETSPNDRPSSLLEFDLFAYSNVGKPNYVKTTHHETHYYESLQTGIPIISQISYAYHDGNGRILMQKMQAEPGVALQENADGTVTEINTTPNLRWIGNGRTILNNKGNPVKQYEPYFSTTFEFENASQLVERGVTAVITYDATGRVIRTDVPDGTFSKTEFDAWLQRSFDGNDTVLQSQWYANRITAPVTEIATPEEIDAANKAALHAHTPTLTYLDSRGGNFLVITDNGTAGKYKTFSETDTEGNLRSLTDARGNVVIRYKYDMQGATLYQNSTDAGERWMVNDVMGKPVKSFNSRNHVFRHEYDNLHRPVTTFMQLGAAAAINTEKIIYGESLADGKTNNLRGKLYRHYDTAGVAATTMIDFKGNPVQITRQLLRNYKDSPDWSVLTDAGLESEVFTATTGFDALNRPLQMQTPDNSIIRPVYNEAGKLNQLFISLQGAAEIEFVKNTDYDAKGQRQRIVYGNNTVTSYQYDANTFRLKRILTTGNNGTGILQNLQYTHDPAGNVTFIKDLAQQTLFFNNTVVDPSCNYTYDAIYRLISATGREHIGQNQPPSPHDEFRTNQPMPGDGTAMRNYTQSYQYDAVGNILQMIHAAGAGSYTRTYDYETAGNRLKSTTVNNSTETYTYDAHGNIQSLAHLQALTWDHKDELQQANLGGGGMAYYVYDATGQRIRKVIERQDGTTEQRIYLNGFECFRKTDSTSHIKEETITLHVMSDLQRIAIVETKKVKNGLPAAEQWIRYQYSNLLESSSLEVNENGTIISYEEYHPYGTAAYQAMNSAIQAAAKRYRYTNMERDEETGLEYHNARYYIPWLCRWLNPDPVGIKAGPNLYNYCNNAPVTLNDTNGKSPEGPPKGLAQKAWSWLQSKGSNIILVGRLLVQDPDGQLPTAPTGDRVQTKLADSGVKELKNERLGKAKATGSPPEPPVSKEFRVGVSSIEDGSRIAGHPPVSEEFRIGVSSIDDGARIAGSQAIKEVQEFRAGVSAIGTGARIGSLIEGLIPNPLDALMLYVTFFATITEAKEKIKSDRFSFGFAEGLAASISKQSPSWVKDNLIIKVAEASIGEQVAGFTGIKENATNKGIVAGYKFGATLTPDQAKSLLQSGLKNWAQKDVKGLSAISLNHPDFDDILHLAIGLKPVVNELFERAIKQAKEERQSAAAEKFRKEYGSSSTRRPL